MENEIWKDIIGLDYQISNFGRVKSLKRSVNKGMGGLKRVCKERILKNQIRTYYFVGLHKEGKTFQRDIHRLVAEAFIPNPDNKPEVNHIDGNKFNNFRSNLEWVTSSEQRIHAYKTDLNKKGEGHYKSIFNEKQIRVIKWWKIINPKISYQQIANFFLTSPWNIRDILKERNWKHVTINK